jgi:hypothetical protein
MPWVSNDFPIDMPNVPSPFPSSPWPTYMNPSFGSGSMMTTLSTSSFDRSYVPQPTLTVGGWNIPSYGSSPSHVFSGSNTQMGSYSTYYTPYMYPSSAMSVPTDTFPTPIPIYPLVFHTEKISFTIRATLFIEPLHMGATYILTWLIPITLFSLCRHLL